MNLFGLIFYMFKRGLGAKFQYFFIIHKKASRVRVDFINYQIHVMNSNETILKFDIYKFINFINHDNINYNTHDLL